MAVGLSGPLRCDGTAVPTNTAAYVAPPPDGPGCRLPAAACSPATVEFAGRGTDPALGAGFRLPVSCWDALVPLPGVVLRLLAGTAGFFFLRAIAFLKSLRRAGETCKVEIAFIKANSSCLGMMLRQEHAIVFPFTPPL